jgi:hypothetical protein
MRVRMLRRLGGVLAVAAAYTAVALAPVGNRTPDAGLTAASALALAVCLIAVADQIAASRFVLFAVFFTLVFLNLAAVAVEGTLFAPAAAQPSALGVNLLRLAVAGAAVAAIVAGLHGRDGGRHAWANLSLSGAGWIWRLLAAAGVYVVLYFVLGGLNYTLVTRPYYEAHAGSLTVPSAQTVLLYEPVRGLLIALSVLPLTLVLRLRTGLIGVVAGMLLFVAGGLVPLLPQTSLPLYLRVASLWEILGQNFLTGVACAYLFVGSTRARRPSGPEMRGTIGLGRRQGSIPKLRSEREA